MIYQKSLTYLERMQQEVPLFRVLVENSLRILIFKGKGHNCTRCQIQ